ncbi:MAG: cyclic pyranopterin monophosphate synthase MoaC [Candidatus Lokiarchaeota archaeon]|nr:cyclic pyranopterin monophosphate synthase MoaC [Candidatus Lokiarchaeota archaeon]
MIDITEKDSIIRIATASGKICLKKETIERIKNKTIKKGDVFTIAKIAAINAVKKVPDLIPLCHPIPINSIGIEFNYEGDTIIRVTCTVKSISKTGVEMEALMGVNMALLNIWDVVKMYEKDSKGQYPITVITEVKVDEKIKKK